jgi:hypothetical protein
MADSTPGAPRLTIPSIPATDPRFKWTPHGDVQAVWRRFGWTPPSEKRTEFYEDPVREPVFSGKLRRAK